MGNDRLLSKSGDLGSSIELPSEAIFAGRVGDLIARIAPETEAGLAALGLAFITSLSTRISHDEIAWVEPLGAVRAVTSKICPTETDAAYYHLHALVDQAAERGVQSYLPCGVGRGE